MNSSNYNENETQNQVAVDNGQQYTTEAGKFNYFKWVLILVSAAFCAFILYILFSGSTSAIRNACDGLWDLLLARVICSIIVGSVLFIGVDPCGSMFSGTWKAFFYLLYFIIFAIAESVIIPRAMVGNSTCTDVLSNNSPTGTPALGILGWISLAIDWCFVALILVLVLILHQYSPCDSSNNNIQSV